VVVLLIGLGCTARACTIFVLVDATRVLFCNNEDGANPRTRIWFVPGTANRLGCVFVSSDDGVTQGGFNDAGVACDWVAPYHDAWVPDPSLPAVHGSPTQRLLESCRSVDEVIAFFRRHNDPSISTGHLLVADRTGVSVIIGSSPNGMTVERGTSSRGFGFGADALAHALAGAPAATVDNGLHILAACRQSGATPTQYATVYDLRSGDIVVSLHADPRASVTLNLRAELARGAHYYEIPDLCVQSAALPKPLLGSMERLLLADLEPMADGEPKQRAHFERVIHDWAKATMQSADYAPELWSEIRPDEYRTDAAQLGALASLVLLKRWEEPGTRHSCYRAEFAHATLVEHIAVDRTNRIVLIRGEDMVTKPSFRWRPIE
jgi:hypothetical protein